MYNHQCVVYTSVTISTVVVLCCYHSKSPLHLLGPTLLSLILVSARDRATSMDQRSLAERGNCGTAAKLPSDAGHDWLEFFPPLVVGPRDMSSLFQSPNSHPFLLSIVRLLVGRQGSISNLWLNVTTLNLNELFDMQNASKCFFSDTEKDGQGDGIAFTVIPSHFLSISIVFFFVTMSNNHWSLWGKLSFCHEAEIDLDLPDTRLHC